MTYHGTVVCVTLRHDAAACVTQRRVTAVSSAASEDSQLCVTVGAEGEPHAGAADDGRQRGGQGHRVAKRTSALSRYNAWS